MPKKFPPEFKRDVLRLARRRDFSLPEVGVDFGVAEESVHRWVRQADVDDTVVDGRPAPSKPNSCRCAGTSRLQIENEILRRAAAYFIASSLPK